MNDNLLHCIDTGEDWISYDESVRKLNEAALVKVPTIGTIVRAQVSVFRCPEGTIGYVKEILPECNGPTIIIEVYPGVEIAVSGRDYPVFFEERQPEPYTSGPYRTILQQA